jgi:hypothetical protein
MATALHKVTTSFDNSSLVAAHREIKVLQSLLRSRDAQVTRLKAKLSTSKNLQSLLRSRDAQVTKLKAKLSTSKSLLQSRDAQVTKLKAKLSTSKSALQAAHSCHHVLGSCAKFHSYPDILVFLSVFFQTHTNLSFRQVQEVLCTIIGLLNVGLKTPQHTTIRNWVRKAACHRLGESIATCEGDQIVIIDESAGIGKEKMLLSLAISSQAWEAAPCALTFEDVKAISVKSACSWPCARIAEELKGIEQSLPASISYAVSDRGSNIRGGIKEAGIVRINDCTHWMSSCIEKYYKTDEAFIELQGFLGKIRQKWVNSKNVGAIAPNMRTKSRFLNLYGITEWLEKMFTKREFLDDGAKQTISFIDTYEVLIKELIDMIDLVKKLSILLKHGGITKQSITEVTEIFDAKALSTPNFLLFKDDMLAYVTEIRTLLPDKEVILCCSDIIESMFGKYKNRGNKGSSTGITDDIMTMSMFTQSLSKTEIRKALEKKTLKQVEEWAKENTVPSFTQDKVNFWGKKTREKTRKKNEEKREHKIQGK